MINLQIDDAFAAISGDPLIQAAEQVLLSITGLKNGDLSLVLTNDEQLRDLNRQFREIDAPTDVLSFPDGEIDPDSGQPYLGDVIISVPRAEAQASVGGHTIVAELQLLVVHGVLHLLGYDHADDDEKAEMWAAQEQILGELGCEARPPV